ncbi:B12-binding domain-containing radical SAM protein [Streptomyces galilaeus]|uniref:B12-binding domain-containing radical SAM protein n=1 Tax=Streptomyces galilaeus TaxID=33899 RepID=A0ABW9IVM2_STRGJ
MKAHVLLLRPRGRKTDSRVFALEQLGLSYVAATVRAAGLTAEIVDGALEPDRYDALLGKMNDGDYELIGYPIYPETVRRVQRDVARLRARGVRAHVTVGNHLATLHDRTVMVDFPDFDSAVRGEGESTLPELARCLVTKGDLAQIAGLTYRQGGEIRRNPARPNIQDLDVIPFPARDTLPLVLKAGNVPLLYTSRGCNARCDFCSVHNYFNASPSGAWRGRSPGNVVDEMESIARTYGVHEFAFADEQFLGHGRTGRERALGIAEEITRRGLDFRWFMDTRATSVTQDVFTRLRDGGLRVVFMGLESGYDPALKQMRKGLTVDRSIQAIDILKNLEITPSAGFIMFRPDTTLEELWCNLEFLDEVGCVELTALATAMRVYSGTALESRLRSEGRLRGAYYDYQWSFQDVKVESCYATVMESADTLSAMYNAFAGFRRKGLVSYAECMKLQRAMNRGPLAVMRDLVEAVSKDGGASEAVRAETRTAFKECCEDFLRLIRFVQACSAGRTVAAGSPMMSPTYLC